jgi:hypothetical protein
MSIISDKLRAQVNQIDQNHCAYCQTSQANSGIPLTCDHILPRAQNGLTILENLCLACRTCNEYKSDTTEAPDPVTGVMTPLFHPRQQQWHDHFQWTSDGTQVEGKTPTGRATVIALRMNHEIIVAARRRWVIIGWHPPSIDS